MDCLGTVFLDFVFWRHLLLLLHSPSEWNVWSSKRCHNAAEGILMETRDGLSHWTGQVSVALRVLLDNKRTLYNTVRIR